MPRRDAAWWRQHAADLRKEADIADMIAAKMDETAEAEARLKFGTHSARGRRNTMGATEQGASTPKRRGPPLKSEGPIAKRARHADVSMHSIAVKMGVPYNTLKSWDRRKAIPSDHRDAFEAALSALAPKGQ